MRLIDADALRKTNTYALVNEKEEEYSISFAPMCCVLMEDVNNAPTIENRPKGKWIRQENSNTKFFCSECGRVIDTTPFTRPDNFPFCHCGAEMKGGK